MRVRTQTTAAAIGVAGLALALGGCVIAVGNDYPDSGRVKLTTSQLENTPVVDSRHELPSVRTKHAAALALLGPQTNVEEFKRLFPTATFVERLAGPPAVDAYSVRVDEVYRYRGHNYGYMARDEKWFYFRDGAFVKFGDPREFPQ